MTQHLCRWIDADPRDLRGLGAGLPLDPAMHLCFLAPAGVDRPSRRAADGIAIFRATHRGATWYLVATDFRVRGGSFGHESSRRLAYAAAEAERAGAPVLLVLNTLGVRLMEGRAVFDDAFSLVPAFESLRRASLLVTAATGTCLGLGALLYAMGHYRLATRDAVVNLTGPDVLRCFFGEQGAADQLPSIDDLHAQTSLVHEIVNDQAAAGRRFAQLAATGEPNARVELLSGEAADTHSPAADALVARISDAAVELFPEWSPVVRTYLARRGGRTMGLLVNPLGRLNNMITVAAVERYAAALELFEALGVPVISFLDTPGIDPRRVETERDLVPKLVAVASQILRFPHGKMGVIYGRAFGGATVFALPKVFGGDACYVTPEARVGIMHPSIITQLLAGTPRLFAEWHAASTAERAGGVDDFIAAGTVDGVVALDAIGGPIDHFLALSYERRARHAGVTAPHHAGRPAGRLSAAAHP